MENWPQLSTLFELVFITILSPVTPSLSEGAQGKCSRDDLVRAPICSCSLSLSLHREGKVPPVRVEHLLKTQGSKITENVGDLVAVLDNCRSNADDQKICTTTVASNIGLTGS